MGMAAAGGAGGRRRGRRRGGGGNRPMSEINVTPMVDVMLVLLIVFMVAAPLMTVGVPIDLPETQARQLNTESQPITLSVTPEGGIFLGDQPVLLEDLVARVGELVGWDLYEIWVPEVVGDGLICRLPRLRELINIGG